jgi:hypothetical protein
MKKTKPPFHQFQLHHRHPSIIQWYRMIKMKPDIHLYHQNHDQPPLSTIKKPYIYISSCNYILMNIHRVSNDIEWWYRWNQISIYGFRSLKKHQWQLPWSRIPRHFPAFSTGLGLRIFTDGLSNHLYIKCKAYILLYIILYHIILYICSKKHLWTSQNSNSP